MKNIFILIFAVYLFFALPVQQVHAFVPGTYNQFMNLTETGAAKVVVAAGGVPGIANLIVKYSGLASGVFTVALMVFDASSLNEDELDLEVQLAGSVTGESKVGTGTNSWGTGGVGCLTTCYYYTPNGPSNCNGGGQTIPAGSYATGGYTLINGQYTDVNVCYAWTPNTLHVQSATYIPTSGVAVQGDAITTAALQTMDNTNHAVTGEPLLDILHPVSPTPVGLPLTHIVDYTESASPPPVSATTNTQPAVGDPLPNPTAITGTCGDCVRTKLFSDVMSGVMAASSTVPMLNFLNMLVINPTGSIQYDYSASTGFGTFHMNLQSWGLDTFIGIFRFFVLGGAFISAYYIIFD